MLRVVGCFTNEHDIKLVLAAAMVCVLGSVLTVRLFMRARHAIQRAGRFQIGLTALVGGGTIWVTHFIAMLAYDPVVDHAYEPVMTGASLLVAVVGVGISMVIATSSTSRYAMEFGGAMFGLTIAAMHYLGMSALLIAGEILWDLDLVIASVILGAAFGAVAFHRISRPVTKYCWVGGTLAMVLAICSMHFTGMGAVRIALNPTIVVPPSPLSDATLAVLLLAAMVVVLVMGLSAFMIEARLANDARDRLHVMTMTDPLTGLPNRLSLQNQLDTHAAQIAKTGTPVAVMTLDLDMFKLINDMHGHHAGDAALTAIAERFRSVLKPGEFVARSGGDEFVATKSGFSDQSDIMEFSKRLSKQVTQPILHEDLCLQLGVSIGIAMAPSDGTDVGTILDYSDIAMYRAKQAGDNTICRFEAQMYDEDRARSALKADLRTALDDHQFELQYQLQNDIKTHAPVGFEALLRWNHPVHGRVSPDRFIPIAEETGLISAIGLWVLRTACIEAASWSQPFRMAVNVAPQQLIQPTFVEHVADILMESGLQPERLELEITEASIIHDHAKTLAAMHQIKAMGVRIAMDDFGTGYSSLATLQTFPFDKIKIDRSFVTNVHTDDKRAAIIRATVMMCSAMNIPVLAEGVEYAEELAFLNSENCNEVQGFYFGKPLTQDEMRAITVTAPTAARQAS